MTPAVCIGCGCDDNHACPDGCWWLRVDRREGKGVCSECEDHLEAWDRGDRTMHAEPIAQVEAEMRGEIRYERPAQPKPAGNDRCKHDWPFDEVRDSDACRWCGMSFVRHVFTECP